MLHEVKLTSRSFRKCMYSRFGYTSFYFCFPKCNSPYAQLPARSLYSVQYVNHWWSRWDHTVPSRV